MIITITEIRYQSFSLLGKIGNIAGQCQKRGPLGLPALSDMNMLHQIVILSLCQHLHVANDEDVTQSDHDLICLLYI